MFIADLIDLLLNLACLLLWFSWRSMRLDPLSRTSAATLVGTLRQAEPRRSKSWYFLAALPLVLLARALIYWQIGAAVNWMARLQLVSITLTFRSDFISRMILFSFLSFALVLAIFYFWLLFLSLVNGMASDDPVQKIVSAQLGAVDRWPWPIKLLMPLLLVGFLWLALNPLLVWLDLIPRPLSIAARLGQAALVGLAPYLTWKYLIAGLLALYLLSSYLYFGNHPLWTFVSVTGGRLLAPLRWARLRAGKIDFTPVLGIVLILFAAEFAQRGLIELYKRLAF